MKISGNDSTADLVKKFGKVISPSKIKLVVTTKARTRRAAKKTKTAKQRATKTRATIFKAIANAITYASGRLPNVPENAEFRAQRLGKLLDGALDLDYWQAATVSSSAYYATVPTNVPEPTPGPYQYREAGNLPSRVTFPQGTPADPPLQYSGQTLGGYFQDQWYVWRDIIYTLPEFAGEEELYPTVFYISATITATADKRGSRPMFSLIYKVDYLDAEINTDDDPTPPTTKPISLLYRYKPPLGVAPYYTAQLQRVTYLALPNRKDLVGRKVVRLRIGLRPMFGRGNNNNTTVETSAGLTARLYIAKRSTITGPRAVFRVNATTVKILNHDAKTFEIVTFNGLVNPFGASGSQIIGYDPIGGFRWHHVPTGRELTQAEGDSLIYVGPNGFSPCCRKHGAFVNADPFNQVFMYDYFNPACLDYVNPQYRQGIGFNSVLTMDNWQTLQTAAPPLVPAIHQSGTPGILWGVKAYIQDATGQWWQFGSAYRAAGDICHWDEKTDWIPEKKIGVPTLRADVVFGTDYGIMIPMPGAMQGRFYLLTWQGFLHEADYIDINPDDFIGYVT